MNDLDLCLEVVKGHVNHCVTFAIESETVTDWGLVPKDHESEMAYGESTGHVTDDVTWQWKVKVMTTICLWPNISKTAGDAI